MDKSELVDTMRDAHRRVLDEVADVSDEQLLEPVMGDWTGKDLLAHMAWWHDHSASVIERIRAGLEPHEKSDAALSLDELNERTHQEHRDDPPELTRRAFEESFARLLAALEPCTDEDLFAGDRWPAMKGEALFEMILWDTSRHYEAHREPNERLFQ